MLRRICLRVYKDITERKSIDVDAFGVIMIQRKILGKTSAT